ncbi:AAA family ATPase [Streptomyces sp. NBC_00525]|uniref:AAA family ATPase n=1 Tax=Streptomyces sp. NBC_00525 TaxID=2903660 RepID=UPI002E8036D2|nr:AAA family ATPase [Streptomyces sp. NBC_00525]WUC97407.1 AAA family ATPase [Streptomyces sp. NBC_00525]
MYASPFSQPSPDTDAFAQPAPDTSWERSGMTRAAWDALVDYAAHLEAPDTFADTVVPADAVTDFVTAVGLRRLTGEFQADQQGAAEEAAAERELARRKASRAAEAKLEEEVIASRRLVSVSLDEISEAHTDWVWKDRIPVGEVTLIAGKGGVGKSTMLAKIAADITTGRLPGKFLMEPRDVLYVANEDDIARTVKPRFVAAGVDMSRIHIVRMADDERIDMSRDCDRFAEMAREKNAVCVMFDPLSSNLGTGKRNDQNDMRKVFEAIQRMATECGIAVVGLAHTRKGQSGSLLEAIMGSSEQGNVCRSAIGIAEDDENPGRFIMSQEKANLSKMSRIESMEYEIEDFAYTATNGEHIETSCIGQMTRSDKTVGDIIADTGDGGRAADARDWLREYLMSRGRVLKSEAVEDGKKAKHSRRTLEKVARHMCKSTRINGNGPAEWELKA